MITRQHATTSVDELAGDIVRRLIAVPKERPDQVLFCYLETFAGWHRFYLDAGLLFWREGTAPDPDDDLSPGEEYIDLAAEAGIVGLRIRDITMQAGVLTLAMDEGKILAFTATDDGTRFQIFEPSLPNSSDP